MASMTCTFIDSAGVERYAGTLNTTGAGSISTGSISTATITATTSVTTPSLVAVVPATGLNVGAATDVLGFYAHAGIAQQTGVAVSAAGIHAACVALGLFTA